MQQGLQTLPGDVPDILEAPGLLTSQQPLDQKAPQRRNVVSIVMGVPEELDCLFQIPSING